MNAAKEKLLYENHQKLLDLAFNNKLSIDSIDDLVVEDIMGYGTTIDEKIFAKPGVRELIRRQREQSKNIEILFNYMPVFRRISADENTAVIADDILMSINLNNETVEMYVRFSVVFEYKYNKWLLVHFHGSKPENVESEKDTFGIDEWKQQNEKLQKLVDVKTAELEQKNNALIVEVALERVRTIALGMHHPADMVKVCIVISEQLAHLKVKEIRNVQTAIFYKEKGTYMNYEYYVKHNKVLVTEVDFKNHEIQKEFANRMINGAKKDYIVSIAGEELKDWLAYQKTTNQFIDTYLEKSTSLNYYWYSLGPVALGISTYVPLIQEEINLFKRFLKVFELAYTRYLDIEKAEAQAREAEIELALERVRARTMAMQKSDELPNAALLMFQQLQALGVPQFACGFNIWDEDRKAATAWMSGDDRVQPPFKTSSSEDVFLKIFEAAKRGESLFVEEQGGEKLEAHYRYMASIPTFRNVMEQMSDAGVSIPTFQIMHCAFFSQGYLLFISYEPVPEVHDVFKRFAKVFEQTYTRFLDLQKAEAQAREANIEAALERVRSKALAMHHSDELLNVISETAKQFELLGFKLDVANFNVNHTNNDWDLWLYSFNTDSSVKLHVPWIDHPVFTQNKKAQNEGFDFIAASLTRQEKDSFLHHLFENTVLKHIPEERKQSLLERKAFAWSSAWSKNTAITVQNYEGLPYSEKENAILRRFSNIFEQSYTRFLDLQKAEAQSREAQIELALERVRARTMAMQKSEELTETSFVLFEQFKALGESSDQVSIGIFDEEKNIMNLYSTLYGTQWKEAAKVDLDEPVAIKKIYAAWKDQKKSLVLDITGAALRKYNDYRKKLSGIDYKEKRWVIHVAFFSKGMLSFSSPEPHEAIHLLERFAGVFDGTYTRFLDLQKAEGQAREAKIEASLERVRSKTMAMHNSNDVGESVAALFDELTALGVLTPQDRCGIGIMQPNEMMELWTAENATGKTALTIGFLNMQLHPLLKNVYRNWLDKKETYQYILEGEDKLKYYEAMQNQANYKIRKDYYSSLERIVHTDFFFKEGCLYVFSLNEFTKEATSIFLRFVNVFAQTYRRYLDLQKAEAQAREAQIETALEKVRSRSLAMHNSNELNEVVQVVFEKLKELNIEMDSTNIHIYKEGTRDFDLWIATPAQAYASIFHLPYFNSSFHNNYYAAREKGLNFVVLDVPFEEKNAYFHFQFEHSDLKHIAEERKKLILDGKQYSCSIALTKNAAILIHSYSGKLFSEKENQILKRVANVFEQAFTRFLDLQKAEAQTREAQINLAVERVRAKALAMFKSTEIMDVVAKLKDEVMGLGIPDVVAATIFLKEGKDNIRMWDLSSLEKIDGVYQTHLDITFRLKSKDSHLYVKRVWENSQDYFVETQDVKGFKRIIEWLREHNKNDIAHEVKSFIESSQLKLLYHATRKLNNGKLCIDLLNSPPEEMESILTKMGAAFDLAYKRFEDLQKAEAQTREAEVELALERVRSQAMAMKESTELLDIVVTMRKEFTRLGHQAGYFWHMMWLPDKFEKAMTSGDGAKIGMVMELPRDFHSHYLGMDEWENNDEPIMILPLETEVAVDYIHKMITQGNFQQVDPNAPTLNDIRHIGGITFIMARTSHGEIGYSLNGVVNNPPKEDLEILVRFAGAFDIAHRRFLDLKKAEAHALQIKQEKERLEITLTNLRATQSQLIQSEKMASLGELTAGIAHEIQNPLNFVNNFSEVNKELIEELRGERSKVKGERNEQLEDEILNDIEENEEKINHHGKRADAIVKGMLQHSRSSTNQKEPTDINALADEYLRLSYHGLRAKDKSFNATIKTDFDTSLEKVNIIPQDIGRVILNLLTNAFYAVNEKKKQSDNDYEPTVVITTTSIQPPLGGRSVAIEVTDNGGGIPQKIVDKIFQPFFTTKPTGQGTGLGLSLSYDIVKAHGGELKVETKEGEGSTFIIQLPILNHL